MNRGGIESFIMNLYRSIDRKEFQFDFLILSRNRGEYDNEIVTLGGRIYNVDNHKTVGYKNSFDQFVLFLKNNTDHKIIHFHISSLTTTFIYIRIAKQIGNKFVVLHSHSTNIKGCKIKLLFHRFYKRQIHKYADEFLACSLKAARWMYNDIALQKAVIIPNGIDLNRFLYNQNERDLYRKVFQLSDNLVIGHVGSFIPIKNHDYLIEVFYHLQKIHPQSILLLIGKGPLQRSIEDKVELLKIKDKVMFLGARNDVDKIMQALDVLAIPSKHEGIPLVMIEAQASGLRIIASDRIDNESDISGLVTFSSIKDKPSNWVDIICGYKNNCYQTRHIPAKFNINYNIENVAQSLTSAYRKWNIQ